MRQRMSWWEIIKRGCGKKNETKYFSFIDLHKIKMMPENKEKFL
jgi:hypothetical protein